MSTPRVLPTKSVGTITRVASPERDQNTSLESPALEVFTDFRQYQPLLIDADVSVEEVERHMIRAHVKLKLVLDAQDQLLGVVSFRDLRGERYQHLIGQGTARSAIKVRDVMTPRAELRALAYAELTDARVGDVVETLRSEHCQHFVVIDEELEAVRGLLSASDLARRLHVPIEITHAPTFAEICHAVNEHLRTPG
ncbi:MAG: CBS domain-containing protein [Pseudomonadales bacterium]